MDVVETKERRIPELDKLSTVLISQGILGRMQGFYIRSGVCVEI